MQNIVVGKCGISATVIADSISPDGERMTTMEIEYPRFILAELNTHRMLSKNSASSRAIPVSAMHESIRTNGAQPVYWGKNQSGMQAKEELQSSDKSMARYTWAIARDMSIKFSKELAELGAHKQIVNRITEPWMMMKTVISGTEWANFYYLRDHEDAQPEIRELARVMHEAHLASAPQQLNPGEWHVPYITTHRDLATGELVYSTGAGCEISADDAKIISASCCAQVSYRKNDDSMEKAHKIFQQLIYSKPAHASPVEHQATPLFHTQALDSDSAYWPHGITHMSANGDLWSGNLRGWIQHRKLIDGEAQWGQVPYQEWKA